VLPGQLSS